MLSDRKVAHNNRLVQKLKLPQKKHRYSTELKITAVKMSSAPDIELEAVAEALGIHPFMLSRRKKEHREGKLKGSSHPDLKEVIRLDGTVAEQRRYVTSKPP